MTAMSSLHMGKQLTPTERDILAKYMHNMTDIMLKDDTVFNRTKLHTQRTKYQTEETTVDLDEKMVDGVEVVDGPEAEEKMKSKKAKKKDEEMDDMKENMDPEEEENMRKKAENKARRLSIRKRDKFRMLPSELKKQKMKSGLEENVLDFNELYKEQFEAALEYYGIDNIRDLPEESKAEFFKIVDVALEEAKMAKKDHDGDGKVETSTAEYMGSRDKAIKKAVRKEEVEIEEEYTNSHFLGGNKVVKVKSTGATGEVVGRHRQDNGDIHFTVSHDGKTSKHPGSNLRVHKEETERLDEYGNPAATPDRLAMIRRAADRVQSGQAAKDVKKIAKADMKQKGSQKGMAPTKKDVEEQVVAIRKVIKEGSIKEKIEAYKELNTIIEQFKTTGEL